VSIPLPSNEDTPVKALALISLLVSFSSSAFAAESVAPYTCIAKKTVGWVTKEDGSNEFFKFKPDTEPFKIRYHPADTAHQKLKVPSIEIPLPDGGTSVLSSDICNMSFLWNGVTDTPVGVEWELLCKGAIDRLVQQPNRKEVFGEGRMQFSEALVARPSFVSYVEVSVSPGGNSSLTEGQCGLAGLTPLTE
jgi:hypothetical protein